MNRKTLALIIILVVVVGAYGLFYAAVTTILMPQDLNEFKNQLDSIPQLPVNNDSSISEMESAAAVTESMSALNYLSKDQRTQMASMMRNSAALPPGLDQNFKDYYAFSSYKVLAYDLTLKGNISNEIKNISSTYEEITNLGNETLTINQKMATDFENGDNKAYAADLRNLASTMKKYNIAMAKLKTQLQNIVKQLEK
ncbi:MAG TPA: hypothetical protein VK444_01280 [Methanobacteriaceae archaeon]|nr:hypothetical protein [Methanobacteriaceae archaeon]